MPKTAKILPNIPSTSGGAGGEEEGGLVGQNNSNEVLLGVKPEHIMFEIDTFASINVVKNLF